MRQRHAHSHPPEPLCRELKANPNQVQRQWKDGVGLDREEAIEEKNAYARFYDAIVLPFRNSCLAAVYASSLAAFDHAKDIYDRLRREDGVLNFQDLLMRTAAVLREYPEVREDLAGRYARLLVDEVQDTDPIQAEIMFLLAADDARERDWRRCAPRPGSLFIVGDPKQSIYRFRRADIVVYQEMKRRIVQTGGRQLGLTANFRSQPAILDWVNETLFLNDSGQSPRAAALSGRFGPDDSPYSPAYAPLRAGLSGTGKGWSGVFYLETLPVNKKEGIDEAGTLLDEARRIAAFIRNAVDSGLPLPGRSGSRPARPDDFLIVTYRKSKASQYAEALRRLGVECLVSSGSALSDSPALAFLPPYLDALCNPDDGILLLAVLRGGLFGAADTELYRWKKAGGAFSFLADPPASSSSPSSVADALALMREHYRLLSREEPVGALGRIVGDLGLWEYASLGDHPSESVGALATALDVLSASRNDLPTPGLLRERLIWLIDNYDRDPLPARERSGRAVRIMNLHKTKGLEAPVVFLTATRSVRPRDAAFAVRRDAERSLGALALHGGRHGNVLLARPEEWDELAADEELFLAAERTRLNYVAATRAGAALVVSVHKTADGWKSAFLPEFIPGVTIRDRLPEPEPGAVAPPLSLPEDAAGIDAGSLAANVARLQSTLEEERSRALAPSYSTERAKQEGVLSPSRSGGDDPEWASDAGEILHRLIDMGAGLASGALVDMACELLADFNRPRGFAEELAGFVSALRRSALWRRVDAAEKAYREAPFTVRVDMPEGPVLRRGVIDLAFREPAGWVIVDYKSDRLAGGIDPEAAARKHAAQLAAYAEAWSGIVGERVVETGIYFLRSGQYVRVV